MINSEKFLKQKLSVKDIKIKIEELLLLSSNLIFNKGQISEKKNTLLIKKERSFYILNIIKIAKILYLAQKVILAIAKNKKKILFVSTNKSISKFLVNNFNDLLFKNCFYITTRWIGGFVTNWKNFSTKLASFQILKNTQQKMSKKEQAVYRSKIKKFEKTFEGIKNLTSLPDLIIFLSTPNKEIAISECRKLAIPTIGLSNVYNDFGIFDITIPINIQSFSAVKYVVKSFLATITQVYNK